MRRALGPEPWCGGAGARAVAGCETTACCTGDGTGDSRQQAILPTELDRSLVRDTGRDLVLDGAAPPAPPRRFAGEDAAVDSSEPAAVGSAVSVGSKERPHPPLDPGDGGRDPQGRSLWVHSAPLNRQHAKDGVYGRGLWRVPDDEGRWAEAPERRGCQKAHDGAHTQRAGERGTRCAGCMT